MWLQLWWSCLPKIGNGGPVMQSFAKFYVIWRSFIFWGNMSKFWRPHATYVRLRYTWKSWVAIFHPRLKIIPFIQTWPPDLKNLKKKIASPLLETTNKFGRLKSCIPDISAPDRNLTKNFFVQNMSLRCTLSPEQKAKIFLFLPDSICLSGWKLAA